MKTTAKPTTFSRLLCDVAPRTTYAAMCPGTLKELMREVKIWPVGRTWSGYVYPSDSATRIIKHLNKTRPGRVPRKKR